MFLETPSRLLDSELRATLVCLEASPPPWGLARPCLHLVTSSPPPPQGPPEPPERSRPIKHDAATYGVLAFKLTALSHPLATALMCDLTGFMGSSQWAGGPGGTCILGPLRSWGRPRSSHPTPETLFQSLGGSLGGKGCEPGHSPRSWGE